MTPTAEILARIAERIGHPGRARDRTPPGAGHRVWRIETPEGPVWAKRHAQRRKYAQEARAYREVVPALAAAGVPVPRLLLADDDLRLIVLTELPGRSAPEAGGELDRVHRAAGAVLAILHALPCEDDDPVPLPDALRARFEHWAERARGTVAPELVARVGERIDPAAFARTRRVWCHRDWTPQNWLIDDTDALGPIDFEHCLPDLWLVDLVKLAAGPWAQHPSTRAAHLSGQGRTLTDAEQDQLSRLLWLHALATVAWGSARGDREREQEGRALLAALDRSDEQRYQAAPSDAEPRP